MRRPPKMTRYEAETLLGLTGTYSHKDYQKAYRNAVKENHPDMGGNAAMMVKINQAKDTIDYYFGNDKTRVFTCALSQESSVAEKAAAESAYREEEAREEARQTRETIWAKLGLSFTDDDYTCKPQAEWTQADRQAFSSFRMPSRFKDADSVTHCPLDSMFETVPHKVKVGQLNKGVWELGNLDTTLWDDEDWFYYLYANTVSENRALEDPDVMLLITAFYGRDVALDNDKLATGYVHVLSNRSRHLHGPYWEREQAQKEPDYEAKQRKYWSKHTEPGCFIETPYGYAQMTTTSGLDDWEDTINVPFAYSGDNHYESWRNRNLEAWRKADEKRKPRERRKNPLVEPPADWTGKEFVDADDRDLPWVVKATPLAQERAARAAYAKEWGKQDEEWVKGGAGQAHDGQDDLAQFTWVAQHKGIASWMFVALAYLLLPSASALLFVGLLGSLEAAMVPAFVVQIGGLVAAIVFRKRVIRWFCRIQHRVFGKS